VPRIKPRRAWSRKNGRRDLQLGLQHFSGDTAAVQKLASKREQELLFRLAVAL
jgi:hypothetical protein